MEAALANFPGVVIVRYASIAGNSIALVSEGRRLKVELLSGILAKSGFLKVARDECTKLDAAPGDFGGRFYSAHIEAQPGGHAGTGLAHSGLTVRGCQCGHMAPEPGFRSVIGFSVRSDRFMTNKLRTPSRIEP